MIIVVLIDSENSFNDRIDKFICYNKIKQLHGRSIHIMSGDELKKHNTTKLEQHVDALTDMYLLFKSDVFIPSRNGSWKDFINNCRRHQNFLQ